MKTATSVYIDGNGYGYGNIGDDAVLCGILKILEKTRLDMNITVATKDAEKPDFLNNSINLTEGFNFHSAKKAIGNCDCYISGGGTLIGDELGIGFPLKYNALRLSYSKLKDKKSVLFAIGANNLTTKKGAGLAKIMLHNTDLVLVRDPGSSEVCRKICPEKPVTVSADPAFLLEPEETERTRELKEFIRSKGKTIGINVVNEVWAGRKSYKSAIAGACLKLHAKHGYYPVFFSNEIRPGAFFDDEANRETARMLDCEYTVLPPEYLSPAEMIDVISSFDIVLSMRMHALLFASITGVPFVTISRTDKVDNFMHFFERRASGTIENTSSESLLSDIEMVIADEHAGESIKKTARQKQDECLVMAERFRDFITRSQRIPARNKLQVAAEYFSINL